ncbi:flagellar biosynthesis protein FlhF [Acidihalobacter prosperus]
MKIKRFMAQDMRQAIRLVRDALGADAVILSSRQVDGGIELMAAVDFDAELVADMARRSEPATHTPAASPPPPATAAEATAPVRPSSVRDDAPWPRPEQPAAAAKRSAEDADSATVSALRRELASMRDLLEGQLARIAWSEFARERPRQAEVVRQLERMGMDADLARAIAEAGPATEDFRHAWREALATLADRLRLGSDEIVQDGGVIALLGPTGVGKTTTLAKLAARYIIRHGRGHVALVSTDGYRIGAHAQLTTLGQLLGVPVYQAESADELRRVLLGLNDKRLVLIDTPGMSPRDAHLEAQLQELAGVPEVRLYMVLAANMARGALGEALQRFGQVPLSGAVLTKLDEAETLGEAFSALIGCGGLRLSYLGTGQRIAEDLEPARLQRLLGQAVELAKRRRSESWSAGGARGNNRSSQHAYAG